MPTTSVPLITWTPEGIVLPTDADILTGTQSDINNAFGGGVNPALNTPQGQLASSEAAVIADKNSNIAYIVNQIDPQYASGRFQDAIGRIYFMTRKAAQSTVVSCTVGGIPGTVIPAGSLAMDTSGNTYQTLDAITIGSAGTTTAEFSNLTTGPIPCAAGTLTQIYVSVTGWDSINNLAAGVLGTNVETPQQFELRRQNSVAANSHGTTDAIFAAVSAVSGVIDAFVIDNPSGSVVNYGASNYPLSAHSIYIAAVGGESANIAQAIWQFKDAGCNYNTAPGEGSVETVTIEDPSYAAPQPSYQVSYIVPGTLAVYITVTLANVSTLPTGYAATIQNAILAQFTASIGTTILASSFYAAILASVPNIQLVSVFIGSAPTPTGYELGIGIDQVPSLSASNIVVTS